MWTWVQKLIERIHAQFIGGRQRTRFDVLIQGLGDTITSPDAALQIPAVWRAVYLIASSVAQIPLHLYRQGESRERVDRSPYLSVLQAPSPGITQYTFRRTLTAHAVLTGNGYAWVRWRQAAPTQLVILDPVSTEAQEQNGKLFWKTQLENTQVLIPDDEVLHVVGLSWDGLSGISCVEKFGAAFHLAQCLLDHARGFFQRGTMLSGWLKVARPLSVEERAELQKAFRDTFAGAQQSWQVPVLGGGVEWESATVDPDKAQLPELHLSTIRDIAAVFGLPPHKLGDPTRTSYASLEQENLDYLMFSLESWLAAWEAELNIKFAPPGCYWEHNRNALVRSVYTDRVNGYSRMIGMGVLSPNEVRRMENLPIRPGGDRYYVPANWVAQNAGESNPS